MGKLCFGVDLGGTTVKMGIFTVEGSLLEDWEIPTRKEDKGAYILDDIAASINKKVSDENIDPEDVIGVGIGVPGPVTPSGIVKGCVNIGWGDTPVEETLKDKTGFIVKAGNDANVAALGGIWEGGGSPRRDVAGWRKRPQGYRHGNTRNRCRRRNRARR